MKFESELDKKIFMLCNQCWQQNCCPGPCKGYTLLLDEDRKKKEELIIKQEVKSNG